MRVRKKVVVISLFDNSGIMVSPWLDAGCECWLVDTRHPPAFDMAGVTKKSDRLYLVHHDLSTPWLFPGNREDVAIVFAFPPCDHLAVSGARWFKGKGLRLLAKSVELFASASEFCIWANAPYCIENPVSVISSHWRKPDHTFSPHHFTGYHSNDNYTKKTCLWTGNGFVMPKPFTRKGLPEPDRRIHQATPSPDRSRIRSMTPYGFALAVFTANKRFIAE